MRRYVESGDRALADGWRVHLVDAHGDHRHEDPSENSVQDPEVFHRCDALERGSGTKFLAGRLFELDVAETKVRIVMWCIGDPLSVWHAQRGGLALPQVEHGRLLLGERVDLDETMARREEQLVLGLADRVHLLVPCLPRDAFGDAPHVQQEAARRDHPESACMRCVCTPCCSIA
eukprot:4614078-Prymnesium_polylepis.2